MSREAFEMPCLNGPRNEAFEERVDPVLRSEDGQVDRPLWQASDERDDGNFDGLNGEEEEEGDDGSLEKSRDDEDVGSLGETRDEEQVVRVGVRSDEDDDLRHGHEEWQGEREEGDEDDIEEQEKPKAADAEKRNGLMLLAEESLSMISWADADTRDASSSQTADMLQPEQQELLTYSSPPTPSRKRSRSLGSGSEDSEDGTTKQTPKRPRLHEQPREVYENDEEYLTAGRTGVATNGDSTPVHQPTSANSEAALTQTDRSTAHGINSKGTKIRVPSMSVWDSTHQLTNLRLPTSRGLPDRPWTEEEKEDLRVYIQDYGVEDWALLSQSTRRRVKELKNMYLEIIKARNIQAGRPEDAGLPIAYPNLAPPPRPQSPESTVSPVP